MTIFSALNTSSSGLHVFRSWMDSISGNIANIDTVKPTSEAAFQTSKPIAEAVDPAEGGGARVIGMAHSDPAGKLQYEPDHPLADAQGYVRYPDVDLGDQMTQMMMAERGYQANLAVIDRVHDAYQQALQIGRT